MNLFTCKACRTTYVVTRRSEPSPHEPHCEECDAPLPDRDGGDWLHYGRRDIAGREDERAQGD